MATNSFGLPRESARQSVAGFSAAAAAVVGSVGTAAVLYLVRGESRPLFKEFNVEPIIGMPVVIPDDKGELAFHAPMVGFRFGCSESTFCLPYVFARQHLDDVKSSGRK
ncbi:MAG: hypothetical protein GY822_06220 [Deltaproteobacteria bacterium]|nr:hypothetical protein [Deltaproteobacteria bacterium]